MIGTASSARMRTAINTLARLVWPESHARPLTRVVADTQALLNDLHIHKLIAS
jgi:hypothetical protein